MLSKKSSSNYVPPATLPGRNDPCHCGSGKKYKKCCEEKDAAATHAVLEKKWTEAEKAAAQAAKEAAEKKESATPEASTQKPRTPEAQTHTQSKHTTFVTPKFNMPRKAGGG